MVKGEVDAANEAEARVKIRAQQLIPLKIATKRGGTTVRKAGAKGSVGNTKVNAKELQIFTRQFAVLISSGVPVVQSIESMAQGAKSPALLKVLTELSADVARGKRLYEAMAAYPKVFDRMYVNLVKAGEEGGVLDEILNRLADYIEKSVKIQGKIKGAMMYPAVIIFVAFAVIAGIMIFVIPSFVTMFKEAGMELPSLTIFVMDLSDLFVAYWWVLIGAVGGLFFGVKGYYGTAEGKKNLDTIMINLPIMGPLQQKGAVARFSRTLSTLLTAGVRIVDCLEIASATTGNYVIEMALIRSKDSISKGRTLAEPLRGEKHIPKMVSQMITIGEQTGNLDQMLSKVADFFEDEVETAAEAMTAMIEPLLMVFLGGIIAVLVVAMYLPIFNLAGSMG